MPAPATGREDWDAETKSRCAGKFIGNIADENIIVAVEKFLIIKKDRFLSVFKCFFFFEFLRNDRQKHANTNKTISRRAAGQKK